MKYEKIKLEELKYLNNTNMKNKSNNLDLIQLLIGNVDYSTESRQKYSLLNKLVITANKTASNYYDFSTTCEKANFYFHVDFIKKFFHSKFFNTFIHENSTISVTKLKNNVFSTFTRENKIAININIFKSYIHLIDIPENSHNLSKFISNE